ncbi:MAG: hypothetical protein R2823_06935 [Acidimicrobiia bacterium]
MVVFFMLLLLIVQIGFLVVARNATAVAVDAAVRAASVDGEVALAADRLGRDIGATVPGSSDARISVVSDGRSVTGSVSFSWTPPGPDLIPIRIEVTRSAPVVIPP